MAMVAETFENPLLRGEGAAAITTFIMLCPGKSLWQVF